jgi:hypothetical protein
LPVPHAFLLLVPLPKGFRGALHVMIGAPRVRRDQAARHLMHCLPVFCRHPGTETGTTSHAARNRGPSIRFVA